MSGICFPGDDRPGPLHSFKLLYPDDICTFLLVAHSLTDSQLFTTRIVRLEDIFPPPDEKKAGSTYILGRKAPLEEGRGFLVTFDLQQMVTQFIPSQTCIPFNCYCMFYYRSECTVD